MNALHHPRLPRPHPTLHVSWHHPQTATTATTTAAVSHGSHRRLSPGLATTLAVIAGELLLVDHAADADRPLVGGLLLGAAIGALAVAAALRPAIARLRIDRPRSQSPGDRAAFHQTRTQRRSPLGVDDSWFTGHLDGFPTLAIEPLLHHDTDRGTIYLAWIFATHGHDTTWIRRHLDVPPGVAHALVSAARDHQAPSVPAPRD